MKMSFYFKKRIILVNFRAKLVELVWEQQKTNKTGID